MKNPGDISFTIGAFSIAFLTYLKLMKLTKNENYKNKLTGI